MSLALTRKTSNRTYFLRFVSENSLSYTLLNLPVAKFEFTDQYGNVASRLVTDQVYYFTIIRDDVQYALIKSPFTGSAVNPSFDIVRKDTLQELEGALFLFFPKGNLILNSTNIASFIFARGDSVDTSRQFYTRATDFYFLSGKQQIAVDCTPSCQGKLCNEENDCGLPCGCGGPNFKCLPDGSCLDTSLNLPPQQCPNDGTAICGSSGGLCFGRCPDGHICSRNSRGRYECVPQNSEINNYTNLVWVALILFAILIAVFVFWARFRSTFEKRYDTPMMSPRVTRVVTQTRTPTVVKTTTTTPSVTKVTKTTVEPTITRTTRTSVEPTVTRTTRTVTKTPSLSNVELLPSSVRKTPSVLGPSEGSLNIASNIDPSTELLNLY